MLSESFLRQDPIDEKSMQSYGAFCAIYMSERKRKRERKISVKVQKVIHVQNTAIEWKTQLVLKKQFCSLSSFLITTVFVLDIYREIVVWLLIGCSKQTKSQLLKRLILVTKLGSFMQMGNFMHQALHACRFCFYQNMKKQHNLM